jgi:hypothetical protein
MKVETTGRRPVTFGYAAIARSSRHLSPNLENEALTGGDRQIAVVEDVTWGF